MVVDAPRPVERSRRATVQTRDARVDRTAPDLIAGGEPTAFGDELEAGGEGALAPCSHPPGRVPLDLTGGLVEAHLEASVVRILGQLGEALVERDRGELELLTVSRVALRLENPGRCAGGICHVPERASEGKVPSAGPEVLRVDPLEWDHLGRSDAWDPRHSPTPFRRRRARNVWPTCAPARRQLLAS